jgi:threonine dehydrogenase-like Zn-dependent dehydrogenase
MLAGNFIGPRRIELVDVPEPQLPKSPSDSASPGQIIFQPECTCLCGSDLPFFRGTDEWPIEVGHSLHEMTGTVVDTNGSRFEPGERVLCVPVNQLGLFERFVVDETRAIPLDTRVSEEEAMLAQPLGTAIYALKKLPNLTDLDVAVVGQGPMGQLFNASLRNLGARHVIGIDLLESRLAQSPTFGATETVCNKTDDPVAAVKEILGGNLPDVVIEAVGHYDQQFNLCIDLCRHFGKILYFGVPPETIEVRWRDLLFKNLTVHTSINPDFSRDFPLAMRWIGEGRLNVKPLITHRYPLSEIQEAFEVFLEKRDGALKVLVEFPSWKKN